MSIGLARPACGGRNDAQRRQGVGAELRQLEAVRLAGVGEQDAGAAGVGDDTDARAGGYRLRREQGGDVEQLLERAGADHAGLIEEGVDGDVEAGQRRGVARRGARAGRRAARLHRHDRLVARHLGRQPANLRGLPKLSRYSRMTSVRGSSAQ